LGPVKTSSRRTGPPPHYLSLLPRITGSSRRTALSAIMRASGVSTITPRHRQAASTRIPCKSWSQNHFTSPTRNGHWRRVIPLSDEHHGYEHYLIFKRDTIYLQGCGAMHASSPQFDFTTHTSSATQTSSPLTQPATRHNRASPEAWWLETGAVTCRSKRRPLREAQKEQYTLQ
jgi:hypothetical protein